MCKCTPSVRTPFCGKPGCEWPKDNTGKRLDKSTLDENMQKLTREELFNKVMDETSEKMKEVIAETARAIVCDYLPYVESDVDANVEFRTRDAIKAILAGNKQAIERLGVSALASGYDGEAMRAAIYHQFKDEIRDGVIADLEKRVEQLSITRY